MSLIARHLEAEGIPTLCISSALDIIQAARPPRAVFVDYPLGHTTGRAFDVRDQEQIIAAALQAFESIQSAGQVLHLPNTWSEDHQWRVEAVDPARGDTRQVRDTTPRYQSEGDRLLAQAQSQSAD